MAKPRKFSPEFKAKIALAALRGEATTAELCRKHQLSDTLISRWKLQASLRRNPTHFSSASS